MARFDHDTYRSLNASINGVQNQPAALGEMAQTPARAREMSKRIAAERDPKKKAYLKQWDAGEKVSNRTYGTKGRIIKAHRPGSHQEAVEYAEFLEGILNSLCEELDLDVEAEALNESFRTLRGKTPYTIEQQRRSRENGKRLAAKYAAAGLVWREKTPAERGSGPSGQFGWLPKLKNESVDSGEVSALTEAQEYAEFLEGILDTLCEELGLDPQAVMEDIQTPEREAESEKNMRKLSRRAGDWATRLNNMTSRRKATRERQIKADAAAQAAEDRHRKEQKSKTVYGKGGKPVRKGSKDYKRAMEHKRKKDAKKRADAVRHEQQKRESEAWHRSQARNPDHHAQMQGYEDAAHRLGPRIDHENYR